MVKGQITIVQAILFFTVSFSMFTGVALLFKSHADRTEFTVSMEEGRLISDFSVACLTSLLDAPSAEKSYVKLTVPARIGNSFLAVKGAGCVESYVVGKEEYAQPGTCFNLNLTYPFGGEAEGSRTIKLLLDRENKFIEVSKG